MQEITKMSLRVCVVLFAKKEKEKMGDDLPERPYWRPAYAECTASLLPRIERYYAAIRKYAQNPDNQRALDEFAEEQRRCVIEEDNRRPERELPPEVQQQREVRMSNLERALQHVFGNSLCPHDRPINFELRLLHEIVELISDGLFGTNYRQYEARPRGYDYYYTGYERIENELVAFFSAFRQPLESGRTDWYIQATNFFNRFLFIHPYPNGNGRIARILLSAYLINYTIVPLSLFSWRRESNEIYLDCLEEAHHYGNDTLLKCLIIECIHYNLENCVNALDIPVL